MTDRWPPGGSTTWYTVTEDISGTVGGKITYDYVQLGKNTDLATARVLRHGGPTEADMAFRSVLYSAVGAIAVASGHAEAAMMRAILSIGDAAELSFKNAARWTWTEMEKRLDEIAATDSRVIGLGELMKWARVNRVKERRDNAIHAYWWDWAGCGARRARFWRSGESATMVGTIEDLVEDANLIYRFAESLDDAMESTWPQVRLHRLSSDSSDP